MGGDRKTQMEARKGSTIDRDSEVERLVQIETETQAGANSGGLVGISPYRLKASLGRWAASTV